MRNNLRKKLKRLIHHYNIIQIMIKLRHHQYYRLESFTVRFKVSEYFKLKYEKDSLFLIHTYSLPSTAGATDIITKELQDVNLDAEDYKEWLETVENTLKKLNPKTYGINYVKEKHVVMTNEK